mgnify:CR=1 FL=1
MWLGQAHDAQTGAEALLRVAAVAQDHLDQRRRAVFVAAHDCGIDAGQRQSVAERALLRKRGQAFAQRSSGAIPGANQSVFLVDTLGELQMFYAAADVAFVFGAVIGRCVAD